MESGKKSLEELTTAGVFHIPDYQRYYSWRESEWDDLWSDLYTLPEGKQHYFGTIIIQKTEEEETAEQPDGYGSDTSKPINLLIDGQQRLTSLMLLVKSLTEGLEAVAPETEHEEAIRDDIKEMEEKFLVEDNIYLLRLLDEEDWKYLKRIINDDPQLEPNRQSQQLMIDAKQYFDNKVSALQSDSELAPVEVANELNRLWKTILDLELMVYVVDADSPEKATLIFDSVNDRGRDLSTFDKTKSFLMRMVYLAAEDEEEGQALIQRIRDAFGQMYNAHQRMLNSPYIDDISDDAVQRYHFISFFDWSDRQEHQTPAFLNELKARVRHLRQEDADECLEFIRNYIDSLETGFNELGNILDYHEDDKIADLIDRIHRLRHATKFYPLLLTAWPNLSYDERCQLLDAIETYIFRVYAIGNHPTYTGRSSIQTLTRDTQGDSPVDVWLSGIVDIMNRYEDDDQFRRTLSSSDLYTKVTSQDLRYLLYFYNEARAEEEGERGSISLDEAMGDGYTIEHIWPQTPDELPIEDAGEYPSAEQRYDAYKHRLGNLTLASKPWNSEWGNEDFETKRDEGYDESKLWVQWEIKNYREWSIENIESRERDLIDYVMDRWETPTTRFSEIETPEDAILELTVEERYVLRALCENPDGAARRVVHRDASKLDGSPFENPQTNGPERNTVGSILSRLVGVRLAHRNKSTWYPSEAALEADIEI
jgi:hypothetical protein